jgi:uncharacterized protein (TIRG00374 family)
MSDAGPVAAGASAAGPSAAGPSAAGQPDSVVQERSTPTLDKKKSIILGIVGFVVIAIIFVRVIPQIGSYADAVDALKAMSLGAMIAIGITVVIYLAVYGLPFMAATPGLPYWRSQQLNQAAFAISNGVPAGGAFGLGVQYAMLASYGVSPTASTAAIVSVGVWSIFLTLGLPIFGAIAIQLSGLATKSYLGIAAIGLVLLVLMIVVFALIMRSESLARSIGRLGNKILNPLLRRFHRDEIDLVPMVVKFRTDIVDLVKRRWAAITGAQVGVSLTQFLIFYACLRGVEGWSNGGTSFAVVFGSFAVAQIGLMIPITPGGLGTVDAVMIALLTSMGVDAGVATAADLVWRAASFVPQITIGVIALITWSKTAARALAERDAAKGATTKGATATE